MSEPNGRFESREAFLRSERRRLMDAVNEIEGQTRSLLQGEALEGAVQEMVEQEWLLPDANERLERVLDLCAYLRTLLGEPFEEMREEIERNLISAAMTVQEISETQQGLTQELEAVEMESLEGAQPPPPDVVSKAGMLRSWLERFLKPAIKRVFRHLWQIISGMLTPKSWTLQGGVSVPGLASAQISITFGT